MTKYQLFVFMNVRDKTMIQEEYHSWFPWECRLFVKRIPPSKTTKYVFNQEVQHLQNVSFREFFVSIKEYFTKSYVIRLD